MFFILSKTIGLLTKPFSWLVILMLATVLWRKPKTKRILLIITLAVLLVFTNPMLLDFALKKWEPKPVAVESLKTYDIGIVLGGFAGYISESDNVELTAAGDRIWQAVSLYKQGKIKKILISGGGWKKTKLEAEAVRDILLLWGIPAEDILAEAGSLNTRENAKNTADLIAATQPGAKCLLITSALHMPRALACFRKAGLDPDTFPADHISHRSDTFWLDQLVPKAVVLTTWDRIINEWVGMVVYKMQGYI